MLQSLRARLIGVSVAVATLSLLGLSLVVYVVVRSNMLQALDERIGGLTQQHAAELGQWIADRQQLTGSLQIAVHQEQPLPFLQAAEMAGLDLAYFVMADKRHAFTQPRPEGFDGTTRDWYKQAVAAGGPAITPAYPDAATGQLTVSLVQPVTEGGRTLAVVGSDINLSTVVKKVTAIRATGQSFAFLIDGTTGAILAHANQALALKPVKELAPELDSALLTGLAGQQGHRELLIEGRPQLLYAASVKGTPWILAVAADKADALSALDRLGRVAGLSTVLFVLASGLVMAWVVARMLRRLAVVRDALQGIASGEGDLTRRMDASGRDELSQIAQAFNQFADKIAAVLLRMREAAESVRNASSEIATGNNDLSARTEQQAGSLEETAAAMEQITATVQQNAANAREADTLAQDASQVARQGGAAVEQVVHTMAGINSASRKIEDIIGVIDSIAFQTNILALNAAVEAARAGEQGRGFAVVAAEVRQLAQRSATAAKEIKELIDDSVRQVDAGSRLVQDAGQTMGQVEHSIRRVSAIVAEISSASQEQSTGIAEIGSAVSLMDQGTQQNAALVEQATAAAQSLRQQSYDLAQLVAAFKLPQGAAGQRLLT
ncbi:methyl-accepting chemotaxis sensory transducer with Cache sensor [Oryzisolibacter propanilivorax]|uniref:Methyl-accepting chemotaxis sensory transducer with Cache sensor n=1 Tax=Oryzisolibacter propanilivorax TaxID=1527607 RepID=A0A1G9VPR8_9BURK|nr:methyl-accepting chemotaxis protein [Oryzisolibacter propanilivorax]SDM74097.1 methyl-accepting chemotaxis sensory transducer with Cache sensor [Oryzisolibacter propanilivorax]